MNQATNACHSCEESIRRAPIASVVTAFLAGVVFRILPVSALVGALIRLIFILVRPALLIFGVVKIFEAVRARNRL